MSETQTPSDEDFMRSFVELQRKVADISNAAVGGAQLVTGDIVGSFATTRSGCLICDGSTIADADYGPLATYIRANLPAAYVVDVAHVKLPDYRGATLAGADAATFILGTEVGTETTSLTAAQSGSPAHTHPGGAGGTTGAESAHTHSGTTGNNNVDHHHDIALPAVIASGSTPNNINAGALTNTQSTGGQSTVHTHSFTTGAGSSHTHSFTDPTTGSSSAVGATTPHTNIQPTLPSNWFIKW